MAHIVHSQHPHRIICIDRLPVFIPFGIVMQTTIPGGRKPGTAIINRGIASGILSPVISAQSGVAGITDIAISSHLLLWTKFINYCPSHVIIIIAQASFSLAKETLALVFPEYDID